MVTKNKYKDKIPFRKSKKSNLTGRVGMAEEKQRLLRTINVHPKTEETLKISEEVVPLDEALFFDEHGRLKKCRRQPWFWSTHRGRVSNTNGRGRDRNHKCCLSVCRNNQKKKNEFLKRRGMHYPWKTDAHRRVHQHSAKSTIKTVSKGLWFPRHIY